MRKFFLFILALYFSVGLFAQNQAVRLPRASGFVNDFAGVMQRQDQEAAENLAAAIREKTGAELVIVTVDSFSAHGNFGTLDEFSLALAQSWGIGQRGQDSGVLLILAVTEREVKIEVGYGLEGVIPDSAAGRILDNEVIPAFRQGDFSGGLLKGLQAIAARVANEHGLDLAELNLSTAPSAPAETPEHEVLWLTLLFIFIWILFGMLLSSRSRRRYRKGPVFTSFGGGTRGFGSSRHFGGGSYGGFSGGGGFGGFGGGSFGGGGASRGF